MSSSTGRLIAVVLTLLLAGGAGCKELPNNPSDPLQGGERNLLILELEPDTVPVGARQAALITARVTRDATGKPCLFATTSGSFSSTEIVSSSSAMVDANGRAQVAWYAPAQPGMSVVTGQVDKVTGRAVLVVQAVPDIALSGMPDTVLVGQVIQAALQVGPAWQGSAVEVRVSAGELRALGPTSEGHDQGSLITPIVDQSGAAGFQLTAPASVGRVVITTSLFGTIRSKAVVVS
jgi:hypothetical protein